jgi:hypothetical protein
MDYKKLVDNLINGTIKLSVEKLKRIRVMYKNKKYKFDDFLKEYQLNTDPIELFDNLIERGYEFDSSHFAYYINNSYCNEITDWYRRIHRIMVN